MKSHIEYAHVAPDSAKALCGLETQIESTKTEDTNGQNHDNNFNPARLSQPSGNR